VARRSLRRWDWQESEVITAAVYTDRRSDGKQVLGGAVLPSLLSGAHQSPSLVNERGGLKRLAGRFAGHPCCRQFPQPFLDEWQEIRRGLGLPAGHAAQQLGDVVHGIEQSAGSTACVPAVFLNQEFSLLAEADWRILQPRP
jgi:hypothetical protein